MHHSIHHWRAALAGLLLTAIVGAAQAQNVGIGTTQPDASAALDVKAADKGLLPPRLTAAQRAAISSPATGLLVFQTDGLPGYYYFNGATWLNLTTGTAPDANGLLPVPVSFGEVSTVAGSSSGATDGPAATAAFNGPSDVAVDAQGTLYVADRANHKIRVIRNGQVTTLAGTGTAASTDGPVATASFNFPRAIAVNAAGTMVYVAESRSIRLIQNGQVSTLAGTGQTGDADGPAATATFGTINGLAVDAQGTVYVADRLNNTIRQVKNGQVTTLTVRGVAGDADGPLATALFNTPVDVAVDNAGNLYVADQTNNKIRLIRAGQVSTLVANTLGRVGQVAVDAQGTVYYSVGQAVVAWAHGQSIVVGDLSQSGYLDGPAATARFASPAGLNLDAKGTLYVADQNNYKIRRVGGALAPLLSLSGQTLSLGAGNAVTLPSQTLTLSGSNLSISGGNAVALPAPTLSLSGQTLAISGGNTVTLPTPAGDNLGDHTATGPLKYSTNDADKLWFTAAAGASGSKLEHAAGWLLNYYAGPNNGLAGTHRFLTGTAGGWRERMRIDDSGNVGIGTDNPQRTLDVNGTIRQTTYSQTLNLGPGIQGHFPWTHNLGYKPNLMLSIEDSGNGGAGMYITVSYEHVDNNTINIWVRNAGNQATFRVRWIRVD